MIHIVLQSVVRNRKGIRVKEFVCTGPFGQSVSLSFLTTANSCDEVASSPGTILDEVASKVKKKLMRSG